VAQLWRHGDCGRRSLRHDQMRTLHLFDRSSDDGEALWDIARDRRAKNLLMRSVMHRLVVAPFPGSPSAFETRIAAGANADRPVQLNDEI